MPAPLSHTDSTEGPVLVLLHAFPLDREMWQPQILALGGVTRVLAPDLPGFGQSSPPPGPLTVDSMADAVADFLTSSGVTDQVVIGGLSMGGYVAMAFARRYPGRLAGLILADTRSEPDDDTARQNRGKMIALAQETGAAAIGEQMLPKLLCDETRASRPEVSETVRRLSSRQSAAGVAAALAALRDRPDAGPGLDGVAVPTLVLVGEHDAVTPPRAASMIAARIIGSQMVIIPNAGHLSNLENPEAFSAAVREFLARRRPAPKLANA